VRNSNHLGILAYYAMMALPRDMIGFAMTNTAALGVPTFARQVYFGTNPICFTAPAAEERPFVLDFSTTTVPRGKVEVYARSGKELPSGWAVDKTGRIAKDPVKLLDDMLNRVGGGLLPLGGEGEEFGGHKGYGLAVMVDIMTGIISGGAFGTDVFDTEKTSARVCHFFGAINIKFFREALGFRQDMDKLLKSLRSAEPAEGRSRVLYAGLKEFEADDKNTKTGIPLADNVVSKLREIGGKYGAKFPE
jgi:L-2-hydroxycarboxylate dehydrogenase (NAD+)